MEEIIRLLRSIDVDVHASRTTEAHGTLIETYLTKSARSQAQYTTAENATLLALGEYLEQQGSTQKVLNAVYANSSFNTKNLSNPILNNETNKLESAIGEAGAHISRVEMDQAKTESKAFKNIKKSWSR